MVLGVAWQWQQTYCWMDSQEATLQSRLLLPPVRPPSQRGPHSLQNVFSSISRRREQLQQEIAHHQNPPPIEKSTTKQQRNAEEKVMRVGSEVKERSQVGEESGCDMSEEELMSRGIRVGNSQPRSRARRGDSLQIDRFRTPQRRKAIEANCSLTIQPTKMQKNTAEAAMMTESMLESLPEQPHKQNSTDHLPPLQKANDLQAGKISIEIQTSERPNNSRSIKQSRKDSLKDQDLEETVSKPRYRTEPNESKASKRVHLSVNTIKSELLDEIVQPCNIQEETPQATSKPTELDFPVFKPQIRLPRTHTHAHNPSPTNQFSKVPKTNQILSRLSLQHFVSCISDLKRNAKTNSRLQATAKSLESFNPFFRKIQRLVGICLLRVGTIKLKYPRNILYVMDEPYSHFCVLLAGRVKLTGRDGMHKICQVGQSLLEEVIVGESNEVPVALERAKVMEESWVLEVEAADLRKLEKQLVHFGFKQGLQELKTLMKRNHIIKNWLRNKFRLLQQL